ncbi:mucin-associated surface protein [Trypanosoma cruzi cruzi]|nr:mucin-associated surface protein [Trypanosoma cruzi cruzi]PWU92622.1 Mucin-associated surface protein (MASP) [Trypanosoma cruzi]
MAMMMTGRVLLVCALCVLWCGVCGGGRAETPPDSRPDEKPQNKEAVRVTGQGNQNGQQEVPQAPAQKASELPELPSSRSPAQPPGGGASVTPSTTMDSKDQKQEEKKEGQKKEEERQKEDAKDGEEEEEEEEEEQEGRDSNPDSLEEEVEVTIIPEQETEEKLKNASNQAPTETHGGPTNKEEIQTTTMQVNGQSSPEALEDVKQPEEVQSEKDSNNNPQTNSVASIAANQQNEPPADHGESTPPSPTANGDSDKSTEDGISNSGPAADAAGTREEKQNENKDVNPKETPVTATATKTTTATTGDSDGSTAVSHTTSPLLLLVVVACAAAAAVVAA